MKSLSKYATLIGVPLVATGIGTAAYLLSRGSDKHPIRKHVKPLNAQIKWIRNEPHVRSPIEDVTGKKTKIKELHFFKGKETFPENIEAACKKYGDKTLYQFRKVEKEHITRTKRNSKELVTYENGEIVSISFKKYFSMVKWAAYGINKQVNGLMGTSPSEKIGISAGTCFEWILSFHGCTFNNYPVVTMYPDLGRDAIVKIVNDCELKIVFVSATDIVLFQGIKKKCKTLKKLIVFGKIPETVQEKSNLEIVHLSEMLIEGKSNPCRLAKAKPDDILYYVYTSGTTGVPKGVIHTHLNIVNGCGGMNVQMRIKEDDVHLSYLPFAHMFEQMLHHMAFFAGAKICFGNPRTLVAKPGGAKDIGDLELFAPTFFIGVPRVFDTILKAIKTKVKVAGGIKEKLFNWILEKKTKRIVEKKDNSPVMLESLVFGKVRKLFGGRLRYCVSGAAPLSGSTMRFLQVALGSKTVVAQLYGLSETGACIQHCDWGNLMPLSCVGPVSPGAEVKLIDVPEMGYRVKNLEGEICFGSADVQCKGYYKLDDVYKDSFDKDGYFKTGDIGRIDKVTGAISVIDRRKNLAKLQNGEYVSLEQLEMIYSTSPFVAANGICIFVDSLKNHIIAVILIDIAFVKYWAKEEGIEFTKETVKSEKLRHSVAKDFLKIAKKKKLAGYKVLKHIGLYQDVWSPDNDLTTSTMKKKRKNIKKFYQDDINMLFEGKKVSKSTGKGKEKNNVVASTDIDPIFEFLKY